MGSQNVRAVARRASAAVAILVVVVTAACQDPIQPSDIAGDYVLVSVAGDPLPAVLIENQLWRFRVHSQELVLTADGEGRLTTSGEGGPTDGASPPEAFSWESELLYRVDDRRIVVEYVCPMDATCMAPPHLILRRTAGGLVGESLINERDPLEYQPGPVLEGVQSAAAR